MKLGKMAIIALLLLVVTVGAVSAEENATQADSQIASQIDVSFPEKVHDVKDADIEVTLPDNAQGRLVATVDDVEIYNENVTDKAVRIPITIPTAKSPIAVDRLTDHEAHKIGMFYNDIALNLTHDLKVMHYLPDYDYRLDIDEIIRADDSYYQSVVLWVPVSAKGTVDVYIDGEFKERVFTTAFTALNISNFNSLSLGNHTLRIVYSGDDYYNASDRTFDFTVVDIYVHIPDEIVLDHDDCIVVKLFNRTDGTVYVYVDSELVLEGKLDEQGEFLKSLFKYVKCGQQEIEVRYVADSLTRFKKALVNVSYYVDCWGGNFIYGDGNNRIIVIVPTDFNKELITITIDGVEYDDFEIDNSGWIYIYVAGLKVGNHTLIFDFSGDEKYNNSTLTHNFTVSYKVVASDWILTNSSRIDLTLPGDADGNLEVYVDGKLYKTQKLQDGKASISLEGLESGKHLITARYVGNDYEVEDFDSSFNVMAKLKINAANLDVHYQDSANVSVQIMRGANVLSDRYVSLYLGDEKFDGYTDENGIVTFELPKLEIGTYELLIACDDVSVNETLAVVNSSSSNDAEPEEMPENDVSKAAPAVPKATPKDIKSKTYGNALKHVGTGYKASKPTAYEPAKISIRPLNLNLHLPEKFMVRIFLGDIPAINKHVTIIINGMTIEGFTNGSGIAVFELPNLEPGEYNITIICDGVSVAETIRIN